MPTINQLARERRASVTVLRRGLKQVDSSLERLERFLDRIAARTRAIPDVEDAEEIAALHSLIRKAFNEFTTVAANVLSSWLI